MDAFRELSEREHAESQRRAEHAAELGALVLYGTLVHYAQYRLAGIESAVDADITRARLQARAVLAETLSAGYATDGTGRGDALEKESTGLTVTPGPLQANDWPIMGHPVPTVAAHLSQVLRYAVEGAVIIGGENLPTSLAVIAQQHGTRLGSMVSEAFYAGVQKATKDLGGALIGEPEGITVSFSLKELDLTPEERTQLEQGAFDPEQVWTEYHTQHDNRVRPSHAALDGHVFRIDDVTAPSPPIDFGCRCYLSHCGKPDTLASRILPTAPTAPITVAQAFAQYLTKEQPNWRTLRAEAMKHPVYDRATWLAAQLTDRPAHVAQDFARMILQAEE